ncbi:MAG: aldolase/citrate lyase family protein [Pseudomonadota bacterium]
MAAPKNTLKAALKAGEMTNGCWLSLGSPVVTDIVAGAGFDWCLIDGEHSPWDPSGVLAQLRILGGAQVPAVVRVPVGEDWILKQALDMGAQSLLVPMVTDAAHAAEIAAAVRYPPLGRRGMGAGGARATGYGTVAEYETTANDEVLLIVQAESTSAIDDLEAIAATDGVDAIFIGPTDLSADMGLPGRPDAPEVKSVIVEAIRRIHKAGKPAGIIVFDPEDIHLYREMGLQFLAIAADGLALRNGLAAARAI